MSVISLRVPDKLLHDIDNGARTLHLQRAEYIRKAIEHMNEDTFNQARTQQLMLASQRVRNESMRINKEFANASNGSYYWHDP